MGRPFLAPGGMSKDVNDTLRKAFDASMKDPLLLADASKVKLEINSVSGTDVQALVAQMFRAPASVVARAKELVPVEK